MSKWQDRLANVGMPITRQAKNTESQKAASHFVLMEGVACLRL